METRPTAEPGEGEAPSDFMTPMLFQYLVALCCARRNPDAVDITIGDDVRDATTGAPRDVDVTVTLLEEDGSRRAFKGFEVKREGTPLDVTEVEQLCMKFVDMPDVTHRAIVSATGYTANAIKKAQAHNVQVLQRKEWTRPVAELIPDLDRMGPPAEAFTFKTRGLIWADCSYYLIAPGGPPSFRWTPEQTLYAEDGTPHQAFPTVGLYLEALRQRSQGLLWALAPMQEHVTPEVVAMEAKEGAADTPSWAHTHYLEVGADNAYLKLNQEGLVRIAGVHISGHLQWQLRIRIPQFFVLEDVITHEIF
ncbi:MAG TPA: hypothetical protein VET46_12995, partial [Steroidobacteraceae bacterium]|nr:hypothetical protein [Steroidobacteraceae bacterium]